MKIYISDVSGFFSEEWVHELLPIVSEKRRKKAKKYIETEDKVRCLYTEILLKKVNPDFKNGFLYDENGKPYIPDGQPFSISHSGRFVAVGIGDGGVDIQKMYDVDERIFKKVLSPAEREYLASAEDKKDAFFGLWTLKEAVIKKAGKPMPMREIECADKSGIKKAILCNGKVLYLTLFDLNGYKLGVCSNEHTAEYEKLDVICLKKLDVSDFDEMFEIMEKSFPADERRPKEEQKNLFNNPLYKVYGTGKVKAFMGVWEFEDFVFLEHFAVSPECRNGGLGSKMLNELIFRYDKKICLEVEPPETDLASGRIRFYERNGFYLNEYAYIQPPISKGKNQVPLMIMSSETPVGKQEFEEIKSILYKYVYKTNGSF